MCATFRSRRSPGAVNQTQSPMRFFRWLFSNHSSGLVRNIRHSGTCVTAITAVLGIHLLADVSLRAVVFRDMAASSGIRFVTDSSHTMQKYLPESMVGGVAMLDYNNDGREDLFFVNGAKLSDPMPEGSRPDKTDPRFWNRLYRGNPDGTFTDVTEKARAGRTFLRDGRSRRRLR